MEDICFMLEGYKFNYRAAAIIKKDGKILLHKNVEDDFFAIPGGRVKVGESSIQTLNREFEEEIGEKIVVKEFAGLVENFFEYNSKKHHELMVLFNVDFINEKLYNVEKITGIEDDGKIQFIWKDIDELKNMDVRPVFLKEKLLLNSDSVHIVNNKL